MSASSQYRKVAEVNKLKKKERENAKISTPTESRSIDEAGLPSEASSGNGNDVRQEEAVKEKVKTVFSRKPAKKAAAKKAVAKKAAAKKS